MIDSEVRTLWKTFKRQGIDDPLDIVDQITLMLFIFRYRLADLSIDALRTMDPPNQFALYRSECSFGLREARYVFGSACDWLDDVVCKIPSSDAWIAIFEQYCKIDWERQETCERAYTVLLTLLSRDRRSGVFLTPRHLSQMMIDLAEVSCDDFVWDPACGTGDMLVEATKRGKSCNSGVHFRSDKLLGSDANRTLIRIAAMNLIVHQVHEFTLKCENSLEAEPPRSPTAIVSHVPFNGNAHASQSEISIVWPTEKVELLFLEHIVSSLAWEGRCACLVPEGVLFGASKAHRMLRLWMVEQASALGVIRLPKGALLPFSNVLASVIVLVKNPSRRLDAVWFYDLESDGFSLNKKRVPIEQSDIPEAVERFLSWRQHGLKSEEARRLRNDKSFIVPVDEIAQNDFGLSLGKYRDVAVEEELNYPSADALHTDLQQIAASIKESLLELDNILDRR